MTSTYEVTALASVAIAVAAVAVGEVAEGRGMTAGPPAVVVDRRHAALAFACEREVRPIGWELPPMWDPIAGDYRSADGWIRLHTNYAHHRRAVLAALGMDDVASLDRPPVARAVEAWRGDELEQAVVAVGGAAAVLRSPGEWAGHPQGRAVAAEPLVAWRAVPGGGSPGHGDDGDAGGRPLAGVRVLDLTRVIAGPVATRLLAAYGADVLRVDPVGFEEVPALLPESTTGKRTTGLDLRADDDRLRFEELVRGADVLVSGYRPDALDRLGYGEEALRRDHAGLVIATLDAYGWSGPWRGRRGFDSLVQMSTGIAHGGSGEDRPVPLPVQALDHATGYLTAAAVARALAVRRRDGTVTTARLSLARTARWLTGMGRVVPTGDERAATDDAAFRERASSAWGELERVRCPGAIEGIAARWDRPAGPLGAAAPRW